MHASARMPTPVQALSNAQDTLQEYLANSAVFVDMSDVWYDKLYHTEVKGSTAQDVGALTQLDELLSKIMDKSLSQTAESTAEAVARATFDALQNTLLHGGDLRYYLLQDADQLQGDIGAFKVCPASWLMHTAVSIIGNSCIPSNVTGTLDIIHICRNYSMRMAKVWLQTSSGKPQHQSKTLCIP